MPSDKVNTPTKDRKRYGKELIGTHEEVDYHMSISRCQDADTIAMYGLSKSFTIKFPFRYSKILFLTLILTLFYDGWRDTNMVVTYWTDEMSYEESVCLPCETINSTMKP